MPKFELGQAVRVVHGSVDPFRGRIAKVEPKPLQFYRVEASGKDGHTYSMTVEEGWLEPEEPDVVWRKAHVPTLDTGALAQSLKSLCFHLGGSYVAQLVDEAEQAAWKGLVVRYE